MTAINLMRRLEVRILEEVKRHGTDGVTATFAAKVLVLPRDSVAYHLEQLYGRGEVLLAEHSPSEEDPHYVVAQVADGNMEEDRP